MTVWVMKAVGVGSVQDSVSSECNGSNVTLKMGVISTNDEWQY
jgi:hypothetical protein